MGLQMMMDHSVGCVEEKSYSQRTRGSHGGAVVRQCYLLLDGLSVYVDTFHLHWAGGDGVSEDWCLGRPSRSLPENFDVGGRGWGRMGRA
jgi:hypothetical protein